MARTSILSLVLVGAAAMWGCDSMYEDALSPEGGSETAVFKKGGNGGGGGPGGSGLPPAEVEIVTPVDLGQNPINCTANRVGTTIYSAACAENDKSPTTDCGGLEIGLIEVLAKSGELAEVIIRGQLDGTDYETEHVAIPIPTLDPGGVDFDLVVNIQDASMTKRRGKGGIECFVSLGTMSYEFQ